MLGQFIYLAFISISVGLVIGVTGSLMFKHMRFLSESPATEIMITFLLSYSAYLISELLEMSGVISLLMAGIILHHYSWHSLSKDG